MIKFQDFKIFIIACILLSYIAAPVVLFLFLDDNHLVRLTYCLIFFLFLLFITEVFFYMFTLIFSKNKSNLNFFYKNDDIYFTAHPYLPYVMKKNMAFTNRVKADYQNLEFDYYFPSLTTNNLGFANGIDGSRKVEIKKNKTTFRINCLGASTTGNYLEFDKKIYSYPSLLEDLISKEFKDKKVEVNNFGQGGYNSTEILINFLYKVLPTEPDIVILYIGYNDIRSYLTKNFSFDYSNSRKKINFSEWKIKIHKYLPNLNLKFYSYLIKKISIRNSLLEAVSFGELDIDQSPKDGLEVFRQNIESIITICKNKNIKLILSTFCTNPNKVDKNNLINQKFLEIVNLENQVIKSLSKTFSCDIVDNQSLISKENKFFVDGIHFSHLGMEKLSNNFYNKIYKYLEN